MPQKLPGFDARQEMLRSGLEIAHKRDVYLKDVELHHHDFYEVYFLLSGDVTYTIESRMYRVLPGDMLLISPRELHQLCIQPDMAPYERFVLWIEPSLISRLSSEGTDLSRCFTTGRADYSNLLRLQPEQRSLIHSLMEELLRESNSEQYGSDLLTANLLTQLLVQVNRLKQRNTAHYEDMSRSSRAVAEVINYVNLHYGEHLSLDMLSEKFFVSKYHLSHEFNRQVGTSVYRYITKKRLLIARQLMAQGQKPNEVYSVCGFGDYTAFYRAFQSEYGTGPRAYALSVRHQTTEEPS